MLLSSDPEFKAFELTDGRLSVPISSDALTSLTLTGSASYRDLKRDSIHFPLLETLSLRITHPTKFIAAIVAPKLGYFQYSTDWMDSDESCFAMFRDFEDKFGDVYH